MRISAVFILILLSVVAKSQTTTSTQYLGGPSTLVINRGVFQVDSAFKNAIRDTTFTPTRIGVQVFRSADSSLYVSTSITAATKWTRLGTNSGSATWGTITGSLSSQVDLVAALNAKQNTITTGTTSQYFKGDLSLGTFASDVTAITDPLYASISHTHSGLAPIGGTTAQVLKKNSNTDYDYSWQNESGNVTSVFGRTGAVTAQSGDYSAYYVPLARTINGLDLSANHSFATGTSGTDFNINSSGSIHTFNIPDASATARGLLTTGTQNIAGGKTFLATLNAANNTTFAAGSASTTNQYLAGLTGGVNYVLRSDAQPTTATDNNNWVSNYFPSSTITEGGSGTHNLIANMALKPLAITNGSATTTNGATLYIQGSATGTGAPTNNYSLWVDSGMTRIDGDLRLTGLSTDNTAAQVMSKDGSGNSVWRDVSSIAGSSTNIANTSLTADGNYTQNWNGKQLKFQSVSEFEINANIASSVNHFRLSDDKFGGFYIRGNYNATNNSEIGVTAANGNSSSWLQATSGSKFSSVTNTPDSIEIAPDVAGKLTIKNLPNKSITNTDSSLIEDATGKVYKSKIATYEGTYTDGDVPTFNETTGTFQPGSGGSGTADSIRVLSSTPATGNIWIDSATGHVKVRDWVNLKIRTVAWSDSSSFATSFPYRDYLVAHTGAVAVWGLDEASGASTFVDSKGTYDFNKTGIVQSGNASMIASESAVGKAVRFDGIDWGGLFSTPHTSALSFNATDPFSIVFNVKLNEDNASNDEVIISKCETTGGYRGWQIQQAAAGVLNVLIIDNYGTGNYKSYTFSVGSSVNKHVVVVWSGSGLTAYVNGSSVSVTTVTDGSITTITNTEPLTLGSKNGTQKCDNIDIDDVGIFNIALNSTQESDMFNQTQ